MKKVLILAGGFSSEREVSLMSAKNIEQALKKKGYGVVFHDLTDVFVFLDVLKKERPDIVFNALHGNFGEDGEVQGFLDMLQIPYTHSNLKASVLGMNKDLTKEIASKLGITVAKGVVMRFKDFQTHGAKLDFPFVVKPASDGSSVGVFVVQTEDDLKKVHYDDCQELLIVEKYIKGRELTVSVFEDHALAVTELVPQTAFYDYQAKYTKGVTTHILPADLPQEIYQKALDTALKMHKALGCNMLSRSDFRYNADDGLVFLEINTNPGMTTLSLVPEQAKYAGISYEDLCAKLVENAKCRPVK
ncbi:MAG: D-alanine--D-alanine ligase [Alphaproteobacteria bacterium]|nr:D-alanine--D-alanine ligase [Alphaproteobacteria bacterium]